MAKDDLSPSGLRQAHVENNRDNLPILENPVAKNDSTELVLYAGSETSKQYSATWKEHWTAQHQDPLWAEYNKESYKILPHPTLASGKLPSEKPGCHEKVQIRYRPDDLTCFPNLPIELRLKIWRHALPGPRVVKVLLKWMDQNNAGGPFHCRLFPNNFFGREHLLTCRESAGVFTESYSRVTIAGVKTRPNPSFTGIPRLADLSPPNSKLHLIGYINYSCDTLVTRYSDIHELNQVGVSLDLSRVERIALIEVDPPSLHRFIHLCYFIQAACPSLERFTYVVGPDAEPGSYIGCCTSLQLIPANSGLNFIDLCAFRPKTDDMSVLGPKVHKVIDFARAVRHLFEYSRKKGPLRWQGFKFDLALLAHTSEQKRVVVKELWLAPREPEPYDVIYWMRTVYHEPLHSCLYFPFFEAGAIQETNGGMGSPYIGIAELFDE